MGHLWIYLIKSIKGISENRAIVEGTALALIYWSWLICSCISILIIFKLISFIALNCIISPTLLLLRLEWVLMALIIVVWIINLRTFKFRFTYREPSPIISSPRFFGSCVTNWISYFIFLFLPFYFFILLRS